VGEIHRSLAGLALERPLGAHCGAQDAAGQGGEAHERVWKGVAARRSAGSATAEECHVLVTARELGRRAAANRSKPSAKDLRDAAELRLNERHGHAVSGR